MVPSQSQSLEHIYRYRALLRSVINPLGAPDGRPGLQPLDLANHVQEVFRIQFEEHEKWLIQEHHNKPHHVVLKVNVKEGKDLKIPDCLGQVNPFCILTIVAIPVQVSSPHRSPRSQPKNKHQAGRVSIEEDIYRTNGASDSRNPVWRQEFEMDVNHIWNNELHIFVWSSESNALEAISAVKNLDKSPASKNMDKSPGIKHRPMFWQKSPTPDSRKLSGGNDLIGRTVIPLKDIPTTGCDKWFDLTEKVILMSRVTGTIRLKLQLTTKQSDQSECSDSDQCSLEDYHYIVTQMHKHNTRFLDYQDEGTIFDYSGILTEKSMTALDQFCVHNRISKLTQNIMNLITLLECILNEPRIILEDNGLVQVIEDVESAFLLHQFQSVSIKPSLDKSELSEYELHLFDAVMSKFLQTVYNVPCLFPIMHYNEEEQTELQTKIHVLQKVHNLDIWRKCLAKQSAVITLLVKRIQNDVTDWLNEKIQQNYSTEREPILTNMPIMTDILSEATALCTPQPYLTEFFAKVKLDYFKVLAITMDNQIGNHCQSLMIDLNKYQLRYQKYSVNIMESSRVSLRFYLNLKKFARAIKITNKSSDLLVLTDFTPWFRQTFSYWLQTFKEECLTRVEKAVELDKDFVEVTSMVKYSNSSVDVLACFLKISSEWNEIGYEDIDHQLMAVTKLTDIICDAAKLYTDKVHLILQRDGYYDKEGQFDVTSQLCITLNNIEHIRKHLRQLPILLKWETVATDMTIKYGEEEVGKQVITTLTRLTTNADEDMKSRCCMLLKKITCRMAIDLKRYLTLLLGKEPDEQQTIESLLQYLDNNMQTLYERLMCTIYPPMIEEIWKCLVHCITEKILMGRPPEYYVIIQQMIATFKDFFLRSGLKEEQINYFILDDINNILQLNAKSTQELQMDYYASLCDSNMTPSPLEYFGHIAIKVAYVEEGGGLIKIIVKILNSANLPGLDRTGLSDPFVILELLPESLFPSCKPQKTRIVEKTLNPVFDEVFEFNNIPQQNLTMCGAVLSLTILDHDTLLSDDFAGEAFIQMNIFPNMYGIKHIDGMSVIMMPVKRPADTNQGPFKVLKERSHWDKEAKTFLTRRLKVIENQRKRTDITIPNSRRKGSLTNIFDNLHIKL